MLAKIAKLVKPHLSDLFFGVCVVLIAVISYNLGRIRALEKTPLKLGQDAAIISALDDAPGTGEGSARAPKKNLDPRVVASKSSSSKKYHYTWCAGAKKIKEENKLWFDTADKAVAAGYSLAGNCQN